MISKTDFTPEEWNQLITGPQMASLYVALASPSGPVGVVQEMMASTQLIVAAIKGDSGNELIQAVAAEYKERIEKKEKLEPPQMSKDPAEMRAQGLQTLARISALLNQKAPEPAEGYKQWVYRSAKMSAEAAKEGGFLGIGGERVNEAEAAALREIASALNITV